MIPLRDNIPHRHPPLMTWLIILINGLVFAFELSLPSSQIPMRAATGWMAEPTTHFCGEIRRSGADTVNLPVLPRETSQSGL